MNGNEAASRRLDLWDVIAEGLSLATTRNGLVLMGAFFLVESVTLLLIFAGSAVYLPLDQAADVLGTPSDIPVGSDLSLIAEIGATVLAGAFGALLSMPLSIVAIRTFVVGATDRIPDDCLFHRIGRATLSAVVATLLVTTLIFAIIFGGVVLSIFGAIVLLEGWVILVAIVLGIVLAFVGYVAVWIHVLFLTHEIAIRDRGVVGAFRGSWATVRGNRLRVFVLAVLVAGVRGGVGWAATPGFEGTFGLLSIPILAVALAITAALGVAGTAVLARAYRQLSTDDAVRSGAIGD